MSYDQMFILKMILSSLEQLQLSGDACASLPPPLSSHPSIPPSLPPSLPPPLSLLLSMGGTDFSNYLPASGDPDGMSGSRHGSRGGKEDGGGRGGRGGGTGGHGAADGMIASVCSCGAVNTSGSAMMMQCMQDMEERLSQRLASGIGLIHGGVQEQKVSVSLSLFLSLSRSLSLAITRIVGSVE